MCGYDELVEDFERIAEEERRGGRDGRLMPRESDAARGRRKCSYIVREEMRYWTEYEVEATSKAAAIGKARDGEVSYLHDGEPHATGRWEAERA